MRANSWLYQFYSLHSKMHFGLTYDVHSSPRIPSYYSNSSSGPHAYTPGTPGSPGTSPDSTHSMSGLHSMHHAYHHSLHAGISPLHAATAAHYPHHLQYSPVQAGLTYPMPPAAASPGSESDSSHQTSLKPHPSFPFFPSSAAFVCLC